MPIYMTQFSYTPEACAALVKNPTDRSASLKALVKKLGGRLLGFYYCFGEYDGVAIYEYPDNTIAVTSVLAVIAPGHLKATKTTVLFTVEEAMEAMSKAGGLGYPAPTKG
jgi:uncharacterized protein with GYD domain